MNRDEKGYVLFHCDWQPADPPAGALVGALVRWRNRLYRLGLVGAYPDGVGFGNLSGRLPDGTFVVSGTGTGRVEEVGPEHFTTVLDYDLGANRLRCRGPVRASSESLSHAAVYRANPAAGAVIHVHHLGLWERLRGALPTTDPSAPAGTPEMAWAIEKLFRCGPIGGVFVMGGHREGLMAFGPTPDEAGARLLDVYERSAQAGPWP